VQHHVCAEREDNDDDEAGKKSTDTPENILSHIFSRKSADLAEYLAAIGSMPRVETISPAALGRERSVFGSMVV
jgi:hypothetical protein